MNGLLKVVCPICMWQGERFLPKNRRDNVLCPKCGSFERQRHQFFVSSTAGLLEGLSSKYVLHVGAERCERAILRDARVYVALDLWLARATVVGDIARLPFRDCSFDIVWASHVLEHIRCADEAIRGFYRVLRPSGAAVFDVPMYGRKTVILSQQDRHGHVWHPGDDWPQLYSEAGFTSELFWAEQCPGVYGPLAGSLVTVCRKITPISGRRTSA